MNSSLRVTEQEVADTIGVGCESHQELQSNPVAVAFRRAGLVLCIALLLLGIGAALPGNGITGGGGDAGATVHDGLNMTAYCKYRYTMKKGVTYKVSAIHGSSYTSWRCEVKYAGSAPRGSIFDNFANLNFHIVLGQTRYFEINPNQVCRWQYGKKWYAAHQGTKWNSWYCRW